jgi:hypothetical protein
MNQLPKRHPGSARWLAALFLSCIAFVAVAGDGPGAPGVDEDCFDELKLNNLCMMVGNKVPDGEPGSQYRFAYQRKIREAACVDPADSKELVAAKVQALWKKFPKRFQCDTNEMSNSSILKLGVSSLFDVFIFEMTRVWRVDPNIVDAYDNRTVLDYTEAQIARFRGSSFEGRLQGYYDSLVKAGALHHWQMPGFAYLKPCLEADMLITTQVKHDAGLRARAEALVAQCEAGLPPGDPQRGVATRSLEMAER